MRLSLKRIVSTGNFIPKIDGLRFIAIVSVVILHTTGFIAAKDKSIYSDTIDYKFAKSIFLQGGWGIIIFFVISGFVIGLPFARWRLLGSKPVSIKHYYIRRITRLIPPYVLLMSLLFLGSVYLIKRITVEEGLKTYLSSIFYSSNIFYAGTVNKLNAVVWSLEVEIQFYIIAPLLCLVFTIRSTLIRRIFLWGAILLFAFLMARFSNPFPFQNLFPFLQYFLFGFLLVDIYTCNYNPSKLKPMQRVIAIICFVLIWIPENIFTKYFAFLKNPDFLRTGVLYLFMYYALINKSFAYLSNNIITNIGGMCYSIYLIHYPVISLFGNPIMKLQFSCYSFINLSIYFILILLMVFIISILFFITVEQPFMKSIKSKNPNSLKTDLSS